VISAPCGEPFAVSHLRAIMELLPHTRVSNVYGPAEVNQCTYYHLPPVSTWQETPSTIPLGVIWDNAEGLILDGDDQPVQRGEVGELVVRTPTMMRGYWNRPELNHRAFYRRPVFPDYEDVFYRTGDLVYEREDGLIDYVGRKDHQVKVRGYRVELAELDNALNSHEAVEEGSTYVLKIDDNDVIGAAVILRAERTISESELIAYLRGKLPIYAVPDRIRFMTDFPRTGTGKVDRKALQKDAQELIPS
jgi:acyl-coenzyme A synthetase/AMP-(fatty) acid ligase